MIHKSLVKYKWFERRTEKGDLEHKNEPSVTNTPMESWIASV
jgi:hypothetical protein